MSRSRTSNIGWPFALGAAGTVSAVAWTGGYELGGWHVRAAPTGKATTPVVAAARDPVGDPSRAEGEEPEELLLSEARSAVADRDFAAALVPLKEHARRFESNTFAEEREALLIRTLDGLGRTEEARRAADAFRMRFPHSMLFPAGPGIASWGE